MTLGYKDNLMHVEEHISTISVQNLISLQKYCQGLLIKQREEAQEIRQENTVIFVETKTEHDLRELGYLLLDQGDFA